MERLRDRGQKFIPRRELDKLVDRDIEIIETQEQQLSDADDALFTRTHTNKSDERHASQASNVESDSYTISDAKNRRDPREFATTMLRTTQLAALANVADKLKIVFDAIAPSLRTDLTRPWPGSTVEGFLEELDGCRANLVLRTLGDDDSRSQLDPRRWPFVSGYYFATHQPHLDSSYGTGGSADDHNLRHRRR